MAVTQKPMLTVDQLIAHMKSKGITFVACDQDKAKHYLVEHNNYFKLAAYRKNYSTHSGGPNDGKYIALDFGYLVDLAIIDMRLRYFIVHAALDIEHHAKLKLLKAIEDNLEDGYVIVSDYKASLSSDQLQLLNSELSRNKNNVYCGDVYTRYDPHYPVWAFIEIISFGRFVDFYRFCATRFSDIDLSDDFYRLSTCKEIRNASAHSNCILNDLKSKSSTHRTNQSVTQALVCIPGISKGFRVNRMSNARIQQLVTLLYTHKSIVKSEGIHSSESKSIHSIVDRMYKNIIYYNTNQQIMSSFDFLKKIIDNWFPII